MRSDRHARRTPSQARPRAARPALEALETRQLLSTFTVSSLADSGPGSLRQAILSANAAPGPDTIDFATAGTIRVGRAALPAITDTVALDASTAPGYASSPVVSVDFRGTRGLSFNAGSHGSSLTALSVVRAGTAGVTLNAPRITLQGNYIGLLTNGQAAGNRGDGVRVNASSSGNLIGDSDPVSSIDYYTADSVPTLPVSGWQGIREGSTSGEYLMVGTSGSSGILYEGPTSGTGGASYAVNVPGASTTTVYGPNLLEDGSLQLAGTYRTGGDSVRSFLYQGTPGQLADASRYLTFAYPGAPNTIAHSTMGGLVAGNANVPDGGATLDTAFVYNIATGQFTDVAYPGAATTSAYGIWYNGGTSYTIAGGYLGTNDIATGASHAYLVDFDSATGAFSHWTTFEYPHSTPGRDFGAHFQGISSVEKGVYTLSADAAVLGASGTATGALVSVRRNTDGSFGPGQWTDIDYPTSGSGTSFTTANSVAGDAIVGVVSNGSTIFAYQADVQTSFQLSNVISANSGNGIGLYGTSGNQVAMNYIGTDPTGSLARPNGGNGILVTAGASGNLIGGEATGGNNPTGGVFVRPPQGNLISGNRQNGVLITGGATRNQLSGNFVGTTASGNLPLGNRLDGVAIVGADGNSLIGCTFQQSPFVFYNVLSGNGGNGLRVTNSNDITVQANFLGVGANNASVVANRGNGLLVSGGSRNTQVGGVIPLGNVISGNAQNGIEVRDRATGFVSFNTFGGLFAFGAAAPNQKNGILVTSTGGNNQIRTSIISGNLGHGIVLAGHATGVQITETAIGTNTGINTALPNLGSGIVITGRARGNAIGGFQPSVEPETNVSANGRYGIEIIGQARDNAIFHTRIGTNAIGSDPLGNALGGVLLGPGSAGTTIGGDAEPLRTLIRFNAGNGLTLVSSRANSIIGTRILDNLGVGLRATGNSSGTVIRRNLISGNTQGDVDLSGSQGIIYTP